MARRRHPWCAWRPAGSWLAVVALALSAGGMGAALAVASSIERPAGVAAADPVTDCTTTTGVVVAVDFATWGGQIEVGCDPTETTGVAAMEVAGFTPTGTSEYGLAFICLIDGQPANQSCTTTPPASASWSFWYANPGASSWTYSPAGASTLIPEAGSVEAWIFGSSSPSNPPSFPPGQVRATSPGPNPTTTTEPTTTTTTAAAAPPVTAPGTGAPGSGAAVGATPSSGPSSGSAARGSAAGGSTPSSPGSTPSSAGSPSTPHSGSTPTSTSVTGGGTTVTGSGTTGSQPAGATDSHQSAEPKIIAAVPASTQHHAPSGSPWPAVIAASMVAALAGGAGVIAWRRRRTA